MSSMFDVHDTLGAHAIEYDLKKKYPRPWRSSIRKDFSLIFSYVVLLCICFYQMATSVGISDGIFFEMLSYATFNILFGGLFLIASGLLYEEYHHEAYQYGLDSSNLVVVRGVFLKRRSSFPINKIADIYLDRSWLDIIFFLYNLNFSTANDMSNDQGIVSGLSRRSALGLQELLSRIAAEGEISEKSDNALRGAPVDVVDSEYQDQYDDEDSELEDVKNENFANDNYRDEQEGRARLN